MDTFNVNLSMQPRNMPKKKGSVSSESSTLINFLAVLDGRPVQSSPTSSLRFHQNRKSFWNQITFSYLSPILSSTRQATRELENYRRKDEMSARDDDVAPSTADQESMVVVPKITSEKDIYVSIEQKFEEIHPGMLDMQSFESLEYHDAFTTAWREEMGKAKPSLFRALVKAFWRDIAISGVFKACWGVLVIFCAFFLVRSMISHLEQVRDGTLPEGRSIHFGHVFAASFFIGAILWSISLQQMTFWANVAGIKMRGALASEIFRKSLTSTGGTAITVNLVAKDSQKVLDWAADMHFLWSAPIEACSIIGLLLTLVGVSATAAFAYLLIALGILAGFGALIASNRKKTITIADGRVETMSELLTAIKIIKYYVWEESFVQHINEIRKQERRLNRFGNLLKSINLMIVFSTPPTIALILFGLYVGVFNSKLAATLAFTTLSMFNILRLPLVVLPKALKSLVECLACLQRIQAFLLVADFPTTVYPNVFASDGMTSPSEDSEVEGKLSPSGPLVVSSGFVSPGTVTIQNASFSYPSETLGKPILTNFDINVAPGTFLGIAGPVASGKSTIINAILGECVMLTEDGTRMETPIVNSTSSRKQIGGKVSYAPQTAWIQRATVRDNILFGQAFDQERFETIVRVCGLTHDLNTLPNGADSWIEERGANLSGGQRQRLALARAVYREADVYLFDDVLSAVDPRTAELIVNDCFLDYLKKFKKRTVILVTHHEKVLRRCDRVLIVEARNGTERTVGHKVAEGTPTSEEILTYLDRNAGEQDEPEVDDVAPVSLDDMVMPSASKDKGKASAEKKKEQPKEEEKSLVDIHGMESVKKWIKIAGPTSVAIMLCFVFSTAQASRIGSDYWIRAWVADSVGLSQTMYILTFLGFVLTFMTLMMIRGIGFYGLTGRVSYVVHKRTFRSVMYAPLSFFHKTPTGALLNAFSSDLEIIEETMADNLHQLLIYAYILVSIWILVSIVIPSFLAIAALLLVAFGLFAIQYLPTASASKAMVGETSNDLIAHVAETISGLPTIRAFGAQSIFIDRFNILLARFQRNTLYMEAGKLWISFRCDIIAAALSYATALFSLIFGVVKFGDATKPMLIPSDAGLAISNAIQMLLFFSLVVKGLADVKAQWSAFDRIYSVFMRTSKIRTEDFKRENAVAAKEVEVRSLFSRRYEALDSGSSGPSWPADLSPNWPATGNIEFKNVVLRYDVNKPAVLKDLNFKINTGEKIGICGRTGSGKSSTLMALLRMEEIDGHPLGPKTSPELPRGQIFVDGVDVGTIPLHILRRKIATIPQEPVVFAGSVRSNLDPFSEYTDSELWEALARAHLRQVVESMAGKLDAECLAGGANWSLGQRQLLCLARVLLRKPTILLLDEATSAMDATTDALIQETIRTCFASCTTVTVAHRLDTVIGLCDKIMILHDGQLIEYDDPVLLLENPTSQFSQLVAAAGPKTEARLKALAYDSHKRRTSA
ncbi:P-loop containing nucleoside triphosphate hydrolase protein [Cladochytrium replicatum]|nr:P-loop containing nucleoside triphosphate hydrolase protein [Cladochytrium replicatum]